MAQTTTMENAQKHILRVERFSVHIRHPGGRDVNDNRGGVPRYAWKNAAPDDITVEKWKSSRFRPQYPNFEVDVLTADRKPARGNMKLSSVRRLYTD
jgi:hypothetical protein